jgi:SAM-dependent methyltransferase
MFLAMTPAPFMTRCLCCRANLTNLSVVAVVKRHFGGQFTGLKAYELSSYGATFEFLRASFGRFVYSEYMPGRTLGQTYGGILNEDVQALTFADSSFDLVTSNQVFEHVPDDKRAYSECFRVLKAGGVLVFTVPLYDTPKTEQVARLGKDLQIEWLGPQEYHGSRLEGPRSAPVFWRHSSRDITQRVSSAGFRCVTVELISICNGEEDAQPVLYAVK